MSAGSLIEEWLVEASSPDFEWSSTGSLRSLAEALLSQTRLVVSGKRCRLCEIEFYFRSASHPDPFTHSHEIQRQCGVWYFHRVGDGYKGGSFKGLDLTFGSGDTYGGILIRSLESEAGRLIDGPSLCVDFLLEVTGFSSVADLDAASRLVVWDQENVLRLEHVPLEKKAACQSSRVGLSLRGIPAASRPERFLLRRYRFLTEPRRIRKGRPNLILTLLHEGWSPGEIADLTGSRRRTIDGYSRQIDQGRSMNLDELRPATFGPRELCWLEGMLTH